jgi:hypothetical protein
VATGGKWHAALYAAEQEIAARHLSLAEVFPR